MPDERRPDRAEQVAAAEIKLAFEALERLREYEHQAAELAKVRGLAIEAIRGHMSVARDLRYGGESWIATFLRLEKHDPDVKALIRIMEQR